MSQEKTSIADKALKIFLHLSHIPYLIIIGCSIYCMFTEFTFLGSTCYGFEALIASFTIYTVYAFTIGVIPVCLIVQVIYLIYIIIKKVQRGKTNGQPD